MIVSFFLRKICFSILGQKFPLYWNLQFPTTSDPLFLFRSISIRVIITQLQSNMRGEKILFQKEKRHSLVEGSTTLLTRIFIHQEPNWENSLKNLNYFNICNNIFSFKSTLYAHNLKCINKYFLSTSSNTAIFLPPCIPPFFPKR